MRHRTVAEQGSNAMTATMIHTQPTVLPAEHAALCEWCGKPTGTVEHEELFGCKHASPYDGVADAIEIERLTSRVLHNVEVLA